MQIKKMKLPIIIIAIGLLLSVVAYLFTSAYKTPTVTEHSFEYSVKYSLDGEEKTFNGVYICRFDGFGGGQISPLYRYYTGEYTDLGLAEHYGAYTIAQKDGFDLSIVMPFNDAYLMNDTLNEYYEEYYEDPYLLVYDSDECGYDDAESLSRFNAEILDWTHPEPIENDFVFEGFSSIHIDAMLLMTLIGILTVIACLILVKKDPAVSYRAIDVIGIVLNFAIAFVVLPFITLIVSLVQMYQTGPDWIYQAQLYIPQLIIFSLAASISLRRKGFSKSGLIVQLIAPVIFVVICILECIV